MQKERVNLIETYFSLKNSKGYTIQMKPKKAHKQGWQKGRKKDRKGRREGGREGEREDRGERKRTKIIP